MFYHRVYYDTVISEFELLQTMFFPYVVPYKKPMPYASTPTPLPKLYKYFHLSNRSSYLILVLYFYNIAIYFKNL